MIKIENLEKKFGTLQVLKGANLTIEKGDIYGMLGKSGVGKSTLLRCINGLETYDNGSLKVNGLEVNSLRGDDLRQFRKNIGMIFQNFSLLERKTVLENVSIPMKCWKYSAKEIEKKSKDLLKMVGLEDKMNEYPRNLSGGQKQRVAIARALTLDPEIVLCDEATSALDLKTTDSILDLIWEINQKLGITFVIVTHEVAVVKKICNKVSVINNGEVAVSGKTEDILINPPKIVEDLIGTRNDFLHSTGIHYCLKFVDDDANQTFFANFASESGIQYSIEWGEFQVYRERIYRTFIINIAEENRNYAENFFSKHNIEYQEVHNG